MLSFVSTRISSAKRTPDLLLLAITVFCLQGGFGIQMAVYYNWIVEVLRIHPEQLGLVESLRETPGLVMVFIAALTARISEPKLAGISLFIVALGIAGYARVTGLASLAFFGVFWSLGLHTWMPLCSSMTLSMSEHGKYGRRMGQIGAAGSLGMLLGMGLALVAGKSFSYNTWWLISGGMVAIGSVAAFRMKGSSVVEKPRFVFKRKYGVYYALTLLEGCRKQMFITFAVFVLVREFHTTLRVVAGLMLLNNVLGFALAPRVGRLIDRVGERKVLMVSYTGLVAVFLGYAFSRSAHVLYLMYCLDSLLFLAAVGNSTYLKKIVDPGDLTPSLATGVTMNHISAVAAPITGGILWAKFGYQPVFMGGAAVVLISIFFANRARAPIHREPEPVHESSLVQ